MVALPTMLFETVMGNFKVGSPPLPTVGLHLSEVRLDRKGRILLPAEIRRATGSRRFTIRVKGGRIELYPIPDPKTIRGKYSGLLKVSMEELEEAQEKFLEKGRR